MKDKVLTYFEFKSNKIKPKKGKILISDPFGDDLYFKRSVVLITEHDSLQGTVGLVLNKPVIIKNNKFLTDFPADKVSVSLGGPVNTNSLHFLHTYGKNIADSVEVIPGLFWGGDYEMIKEIVKIEGYKESKLRFFIGYSGWDAGQLDNELEDNFWVVSNPLSSGKIMSYFGSESWKTVMYNMGDQFKMWANTPENPTLN
jgi:putative transcriptional regulator